MLNYDVKILVALEKSLNSSRDFFDFLLNNGFPELAAFSNSIKRDNEATTWLLTHGYPHLAALSHAIDDDYNAYLWLKKHQFEFLILLADASKGKEYAIKELIERDLHIFRLICQRIKEIKDEQSRDSWDYHKMGPFR